MFSATWPKEVRALAKDFLSDPVFVNVGSLGLAANSNIVQLVAVVEESEKEEKLLEFLGKTSSEVIFKILHLFQNLAPLKFIFTLLFPVNTKVTLFLIVSRIIFFDMFSNTAKH